MQNFRLHGWILVSLVLLVGGCTEANTNGPTADGSVSVDGVPADTTSSADTSAPVDLGPIDTYVPEPGEFGWPCSDNNDCYSGWCVVTPDGQICTKTFRRSI